MAHCFIMDFEGGTTAQYDAVDAALEASGKRLPDGALFHSAGETATGLRVIDVWESPEAFDEFVKTRLGPLSAEHGIPAPQVRALPVDQIRRGGQGPVTFVQVVDLPGVDAASFAELDKQVLGPAREAPADCIFHVNGPTDDGWCVVDAWTSKDIRDQFLAAQVVPAIGTSVVPAIQELPLYASLQREGAEASA